MKRSGADKLKGDLVPVGTTMMTYSKFLNKDQRKSEMVFLKNKILFTASKYEENKARIVMY